MTRAILDRFMSPATMMDAELELLALGPDAVPVLESVLNGSSTNEFGVPYRKLGLPLRCTLEVARRLGPVVRPLEPLLRTELRSGNFVAAMALGTLGSVENESIEELATHLDYDVNKAGDPHRALDLTAECAVAIIRLGHTEHPAVKAALERSPRASADFARMLRFSRSRS